MGQQVACLLLFAYKIGQLILRFRLTLLSGVRYHETRQMKGNDLMYEQLTLDGLLEQSSPAVSANELLDIKQAADRLSVSTATIRNWVKLGRLETAKTTGKKLMFQKSAVEKLVGDIISGRSDKLTKRRNKKAVKGLDLYTDYIHDSGTNIVIGADLVKRNPAVFDEKTIRMTLADLALKLYLQTQQKENISLVDFIQTYPDDDFIILLMELLDVSKAGDISFTEDLPVPTFVPFQDFLGYIYISINKVANRKSIGSYFTPIDVVDHLTDILEQSSRFLDSDIIDPCCGTGNFLLAAMKRGVPVEHLYGNDIDPISVTLTKLNLFLNGVHDIALLNEQIKNVNSLTDFDERTFDIILGNPPWGYDFSASEIKNLMRNYASATKHGTESYDLFLELSLQKVRQGGIISYVLPEAILNVRTHSTVRTLIRKNASVTFVSYIGNAFTGVACPCILLGLSKADAGNTMGCVVETAADNFTIQEPRDLSEDYWNFNLSDEEARCLKKIGDIQNAFTLKGQADFALGIVTGANKEYISDEKQNNNELVLKGSDIHKYGFENGGHYIRFEPENFQQVAPTNLYRAPEKLIYRFICATPVFAYDNKQTLSLNSANILIPHVKGIDMKYILALLNSRTVSYWCRKKYNSVKLLRSHIEDIPLPMPDMHQQEDIISNVDALLAFPVGPGTEKQRLYETIEEKIMVLYHLDDIEKQIINNDSKQYDSFL